MNKKVFTVTKDGQELELAVVKPTADVRVNARLQYNRAWRQSMESGSLLLRNVDEVAEKQGIWGDEKRQRVAALEADILLLERKLAGGANSFSSLEEARGCALEIRRLRAERMTLLRSKNDLYNFTAESFADDAQLKYFVSQCTIYNDNGSKYFKSYDDYLSQSESEVATKALVTYLELMYDDFNTGEADLAENKFLLKYKFVDDKFRLIDVKGRLISDDGKLIDSENRYINEAGEYVDKDGNRVDAEGNHLVEFKEFDTVVNE